MARNSRKSELEQKFAHLLQPIRDLASNWNIDVAQELEDYLEDLEAVTVTFDDGKTNLNFAEAALLIQGSACVYSKKVEYLYSLIYKTLDHLSQQHTRTQRKTSVRKDGIDEDANMDDEDGFLLLDDIIKPATNIDMAEEEAQGTYSFPDPDRMAGQFTTPHNPVNSAGALTNQTPLSMIGTFQAQGRGTFSLANCSMHESGALMMDENKNAVEHLSNPHGSTAAPDTEMMVDAHGSPQPPSTPLFQAGDDGGDDFGGDDGGGWDMGAGSPASAVHMPAAASAGAGAGAGRKGKAVRIKEPVDMWATLDPYDAGGQQARPLKAGRTWRAPSDAAAIAKLGSSASAAAVATDASLNATAWKPSLLLLSSRPFTMGLAPLYTAQKRRQAAVMRAQRRAGVVAAGAAGAGDDDDSDHEGGGMQLFGDGEFDDGGDGMSMGGDELDMGDDAAYGGGSERLVPAMNLDDALEGAPQSYEELCKRHIDMYMRSVTQFKEDSGIIARVSSWQQRIQPILDMQETRPGFDIAEYGDQIIESLQHLVLDDEDEDEDGAEGGEHKHGEVVEFEEVVQGMEPEDVCRVFLASLQLANTGNVELIHELQLPTGASAHHLQMKLLTAKPKVDMDEYRAPSTIAAALSGGSQAASGAGAGSGEQPATTKPTKKAAKPARATKRARDGDEQENLGATKVARTRRSSRRRAAATA